MLTGDTRKIFVSNIIDRIFKTVDESNSACVLIGCKPINAVHRLAKTFKTGWPHRAHYVKDLHRESKRVY